MWHLHNAYQNIKDPDTGKLHKENAGDIALPHQRLHRKNGIVGGDLDGVTYYSQREVSWTPDETDTVQLGRDAAAIIKRVARATEKKLWDRPFLRLVLADHGRLAATDGHRLHFAQAPALFGNDRLCFLPKGVKVGEFTLALYPEDEYVDWQHIVARRFDTEYQVQAGVLQALGRPDMIVFQTERPSIHYLSGAYLADAISGLGPKDTVGIGLNLPTLPMGVMTKNMGAVIMPIDPREQNVTLPAVNEDTKSATCWASDSRGLNIYAFGEIDYATNTRPCLGHTNAEFDPRQRRDYDTYWL